MPDGRVCPDQFRGYLWKWTNYIKGYQKRWCVLANGLLSYYRSPSEMNHTCRGTINLAGAFIDTVDSCSFIINGGTQVWHLRAGSEIERQRWVTALELAKAKAIKNLGSDDDTDSESEEEITIKSISSKLDDLTTCNNLVANHGGSLQKAISDHVDKEINPPLNLSSKDGKDDTEQNMRLINEKAQLFRITSNTMINASADFLELAQLYEKKFVRLLNAERSKRMRLEETVETLAKQHIRLERACEFEKVKEGNSSSGTIQNFEGSSDMTCGDQGGDSDDDFFEDALADFSAGDLGGSTDPSDDVNASTVAISESSIEADSSPKPTEEQKDNGHTNSVQALVSAKESGHRRWVSEDIKLVGKCVDQDSIKNSNEKIWRDKILNRPNVNINLWSIMKNCIGKELTKIPMPVNFNEPLSMTQRLTEELEYSDLLDKAALCENSLEQICYVAAFSISAYASTALRTGKPFNPLLGETYEFDRTGDMGWYSLAEQVSHHPPSVAHHAEGKGWTLWQNFTMSSKFRGKYLLVSPLGTAHCKFSNSGNHYTWKKVTTTVNNIIVGRLWIDQSGEMDIVNHTTGEKCHLRYHSYSYFSRESPKRVSGFVSDKNNVTRYVLSGTWDSKVECAKVVYKEPHLSLGKQPQGLPTSKSVNPQTLPPQLLWTRKELHPSAKQMYFFTSFTCSLNQLIENVSPTDSRVRPDIRKMEEGDFDEANRIKLVLEESQRSRRREREAQAQSAVENGHPVESYKPVWFEYTEDEFSDVGIYVYKGGYWEAKEKQDWGVCPKIYLDSPP